MIKLLFWMFLVVFIVINISLISYIYGLRTYKIEGTLPSFYKYTLLENKIKEDFEDLKGQNVLVEKGSNRIIKVENYNITAESIISGNLVRESKKEPITFENDTVLSLTKDYNDIKSINIEKFGTKKIDKFIVLSSSTINTLIKKENFIEWNYPKLY